MGRTRQRTVEVDGRKIQIKSYARTNVGNPNGFYVYVDGQRYYNNSLFRQEAEDNCFARWKREQVAR